MTLWGVTVPSKGWAEVANFQTKTKVPLGLIRCYPAGRVLGDSLVQVRRSTLSYPSASICFNPLIAGRGFTVAQLETFVKEIEVEARKVPNFWLVPDAEPDRVDRVYTDSQFNESFRLLSMLVGMHAPHVQLSLNLTGYKFSERIDRYWSIRNLYTVLSLDPYWTAKPNAIQGTTEDLNAAAEWAHLYGKRLAFAEWGAEGGDPTRLKQGLAKAKELQVVFSGYFQEDTVGFAPCALKTDAAFTAYRQAVTSA